MGGHSFISLTSLIPILPLPSPFYFPSSFLFLSPLLSLPSLSPFLSLDLPLPPLLLHFPCCRSTSTIIRLGHLGSTVNFPTGCEGKSAAGLILVHFDRAYLGALRLPSLEVKKIVLIFNVKKLWYSLNSFEKYT